MSRYTPPPLPLAVQLASLRVQNAHGFGRVERSKLTWQFDAQPTPISRSYQLRLDYRLHEAPKIFVLEPRLTMLSEGRRVPHLYDQEQGRLCLYLPGTGEWHSRRLLADTMVPWAALWLLYFEEWLVTNEWKGGGVHPDSA